VYKGKEWTRESEEAYLYFWLLELMTPRVDQGKRTLCKVEFPLKVKLA
jgi:hypothetical protein